MRKLHATGKPFLVSFMTVSNHLPFTCPAGRIPEDPEAHSRKHAVKYTDWALGDCFGKVKQEPFWKDTIFVVVADHGSRVYGSQTIPLKSYEIPQISLTEVFRDMAGRLRDSFAQTRDFRPHALTVPVRDAAEDAQLLATPHGLTVTCAVPDSPCLITGDRHRLRQVLLNLADNAVKYKKPGGFVRVSLAEEAGAAVLEFANPGPGIPPELSGRVFERFFRADPSRSRTVEGSGLGLHLAQWIVQRHGGSITLETGADGLTRATVRLPRSAPPPPAQAGPAKGPVRECLRE